MGTGTTVRETWRNAERCPPFPVNRSGYYEVQKSMSNSRLLRNKAKEMRDVSSQASSVGQIFSVCRCIP